MNLSPVAALLAVALATTPLAWAQGKPFDGTDLQALKVAVKADKKALVASTLTLSEVEAKKFWPLYEDYQRKIEALNRRSTRLIEEVVTQSKPVSDVLAKSLLKESLAIEDEEVRPARLPEPPGPRCRRPRCCAICSSKTRSAPFRTTRSRR
ncbi:MAG: hypothetical protein IPI27_11570 [Betaproteobacteria bacterium]|nr:hypothetical protein [Betaproteobacteria bacterium]